MMKTKKTKIYFRRNRINRSRICQAAFLILFGCLIVGFACTPRAFEKPDATATPAAVEDKKAAFERDLQTMRTADLQFIFVFRRKDATVFDGEDKKFLRANLPFNNRVVLSDDDKAVIVGTNYKFPPENLETLRSRFNLEDFSATRE